MTSRAFFCFGCKATGGVAEFFWRISAKRPYPFGIRPFRRPYEPAHGPQEERKMTSSLLRRRDIGYHRSMRLIETLERKGVVGPAAGAKDHAVLVAQLPPSTSTKGERR